MSVKLTVIKDFAHYKVGKVLVANHYEANKLIEEGFAEEWRDEDVVTKHKISKSK